MQLETLVPDYRGRMDVALAITEQEPPDVFNHNLETVPRLYKAARPGSDYQWSLTLLQKFKELVPHVPTKSGLMLGLGETDEEVIEVMQRYTRVKAAAGEDNIALALVADAELFRLEAIVRWLDAADVRLKQLPSSAPAPVVDVPLEPTRTEVSQ